MKGDVRVTGIVRVEAKCTQKKSFSVSLDMIKKIEDAAVSAGEVPAVAVEFLDTKGKPIKTVWVIPDWAIQGVIEEME